MKLRLISVIALVAVSLFGAWFLGVKAAQFANDIPPPQIPHDAVIDGLAVELASLDLGEVAEQADYPWQFTIENRNSAATEIFDIAASCGCVESIEPRALTLAPAATATIRLKLNLAKRQYGEQGLARRPFEVAIHPVLKARGQQQLAWNLHGVIESGVTLNTAYLDFGEALVRGQTPVSRKVTATVHAADAHLEAVVEPSTLAAVEVKPVQDSANQYEIVVSPDVNLPVGAFSGKVQLEVKTKDGQRLPGATFQIAGKMQPEVRAIPALLAFGPHKVGEVAESTMTLQVPPGSTWVVDHIEMDSADVRLEPVAAAGASAAPQFRIQQQIAKAGHQSAAIRIFVRKDKADLVPLSMEVTYDGASDDVPPARNDKGAGR